jgi:hypothetical protein
MTPDELRAEALARAIEITKGRRLHHLTFVNRAYEDVWLDGFREALALAKARTQTGDACNCDECVVAMLDALDAIAAEALKP